MRKPSEVIRLAKEHPDYLTKEHYLCFLLVQLCVGGIISNDERVLARGEIFDAMDGEAFLFGLLRRSGQIGPLGAPGDAEYAAPAHEFWEKLIAKLESEGK